MFLCCFCCCCYYYVVFVVGGGGGGVVVVVVVAVVVIFVVSLSACLLKIIYSKFNMKKVKIIRKVVQAFGPTGDSRCSPLDWKCNNYCQLLH